MAEKVERALVQGTVTFTVDCNHLSGLVDLETANSKYLLEEWLIDKATEILDFYASTEVEIDNIHPVSITRETADELTDTLLATDADWQQVMKENKE